MKFDSAATRLWLALQQLCKAEFISNCEASKVGLDVPVAGAWDGGWAGEEGVLAGSIEEQPGLSLEGEGLLCTSLGVKPANS